jgi:hypothetical protein
MSRPEKSEPTGGQAGVVLSWTLNFRPALWPQRREQDVRSIV